MSKKKTARELKLSVARGGRIRERLAEEKGTRQEEIVSPGPRPEHLDRFTSRMRTIRDTFSSRLTAQPVTLELGPVRFNWRTNACLTMARSYALSHPETCGNFIAELSDQKKYVMDVCAAEVAEWFDCFTGGPHWEISGQDLFDFVQIIGWKKRADGTPRFDPSHWQSNKYRNVLAAGFKVIRNL